MILTFLLAKVFGVYLVVIGLALLIRRRYFISVFAGLVENRLLRIIVSVFEFIAGLFLVFTHEIWTSLPAIIISLFGWAMVVEGFCYLFLPDRWFGKLMKIFNTKVWYVLGGLIAVIVGAYLVYAGFGLA